LKGEQGFNVDGLTHIRGIPPDNAFYYFANMGLFSCVKRVVMFLIHSYCWFLRSYFDSLNDHPSVGHGMGMIYVLVIFALPFILVAHVVHLCINPHQLGVSFMHEADCTTGLLGTYQCQTVVGLPRRSNVMMDDIRAKYDFHGLSDSEFLCRLRPDKTIECVTFAEAVEELGMCPDVAKTTYIRNRPV
jgi:hypothetical protein